MTHRHRHTFAVVAETPFLEPGSFLDRLTPDDRADLVVAGVARRFSAGATFIHEGDEGDSVYVLLAGTSKSASRRRTGTRAFSVSFAQVSCSASSRPSTPTAEREPQATWLSNRSPAE